MIYANSQRILPIINQPEPAYVTTPLTIKATGNVTVTFNKDVVAGTAKAWPVSGSTDKVNWYSVESTSAWNLTNGQQLCLTGLLTDTYDDNTTNMKIKGSGTGTMEVYGNIMSLCNWSKQFVTEGMFGLLFMQNTRLTDVSKLYLPATVNRNCYRAMFNGCTSITYGPLLLSKSVDVSAGAESCGYAWMFVVAGSSFKSLEICVDDNNNWIYPNGWFAWLYPSNGIMIKPSTLNLTDATDSNGQPAGKPNNFTWINRMPDGSLQYTNGTPYTGEDPYAWYYNS